jgi:hypothetical protein
MSSLDKKGTSNTSNLVNIECPPFIQRHNNSHTGPTGPTGHIGYRGHTGYRGLVNIVSRNQTQEFQPRIQRRILYNIEFLSLQ